MSPVGQPAVLKPIMQENLDAVGAFLHRNLNSRLSSATWAAVAVPSWAIIQPNFGFMLIAGEGIVGVHLAFYSERVIDGARVQLCNLGAFCVQEEYRSQSVRLLRALLSQKCYEFTDLSPSGNVVPLNKRLKFRFLDTATALVANIPWPFRGKSIRVIFDPQAIAEKLRGDDLAIYKDHIGAHAAYHVVIAGSEGYCYVVFRRERRKRLPLFASILYISDPVFFERVAPHFFGHLLARYGIPMTLAEIRVVRHRPRFSVILSSPRPKMLRSARLRTDQIDYLYSELTCVPW